MRIFAFGGTEVKVIGSLKLYMHYDDQTTEIRCQVTNTQGTLLLGKKSAQNTNYVSYPNIKPPVKLNAHVHQLGIVNSAQGIVNSAQRQTSSRRAKAPDVPRKPTVSWCTNSITINGKLHPLPTTKEYILREYSDIFQGVGTLPGGPYHIRLKSHYQPVIHAPRSVPIGMQSAYRKELDRLLKEGIIKEVHQHTEWVNSIVPVPKSDGTIRLCLDPKDLNKAIERNHWYSRTLEDVLPMFTGAKYFTLGDATSGFWHVVLDLQSSLLTTFNTPWGKFR